uniref:Uncharacterized protein n=1 Tax=Cannabis sativa TaxID=3483 RepID=A0A803PQ00_CANSA
MALLWRNEDNGCIKGYSHNHIDFKVTQLKPRLETSRASGEPLKTLMISHLNLYITLHDSTQEPWCVIGDFNNIMCQEEKRGGNPYPRNLIEGFNNITAECELCDIQLLGHPYTWEMHRGEPNWTEVRLDRAMANPAWIQVYPMASLYNLLHSTSDHSPILLECVKRSSVVENKRFRFENAWLKEPICYQIINDCWNSSVEADIFQKITCCSKQLVDWGKTITGDFKQRIGICRRELDQLKSKTDEVSAQRYKEVKEKLLVILDQREAYWKQRSKQHWLKNGDQNSKYFHAAASTRRRTNTIQKLQNDQGMWVDWESGLSDVVTDGYMALKLDMSKAYDRVEWPFLSAILNKIGFAQGWVDLIMACVRSAKYNIVHGGREMGPVIPSRGIRQGDPLSPYIFIICAEGFSALIQRFEAMGRIHGCKVANGAPRISHMFFADDSYLYCKATMNEASYVQQMLHMFENASRQQVNLRKSSIFYSVNTDHHVRSQIGSFLQMITADANSTYLGLPSTMGRNKNAVLRYLKERVRKRVHNWDTKFLSKAGKEILIKTVAQALPSYAMSVFLLPLDISRDMEQHMARFWWKTSNSKDKGIHWMSWDKLSKHKSVGGMGFRSLRDHNLSLLGKQGWRFMTQPHSLVSRVFKARYFKNVSFLSAKLGNNPSYVWRSIWEAQAIVKQGVRWHIGDGSTIDVLGEPWLPNDAEPIVTSCHPALVNAKVSNLMANDSLQWDDEILADLFNTRDQALIKSIPLHLTSGGDHLYWTVDTSGIYSVKSAYNMIQKSNGHWNTVEASEFWNDLWRLKIPPKVKNLVWRGGTNCLPTMTMLLTKRVVRSSLCPCVEKVRNNFPFLGAIKEKKDLIATVCWAIWGARNDKVWQNKMSTASFIVAFAGSYLEQWKSAQSSNLESSQTGLVAGDGVESWCAPQRNQVKVNVDASLFGVDQSYGIGMVARDDHGFFLEGVTKKFSGVVRPEIAEAISFREALSWIKNQRWNQVVVETDCLIVVQALRTSCEMRSLFGLIIKECKLLLAELRNVSFHFVKRSANVVAHAFARASSLYSGCTFSMGNIPTDLLSCLIAEFEV